MKLILNIEESGCKRLQNFLFISFIIRHPCGQLNNISFIEITNDGQISFSKSLSKGVNTYESIQHASIQIIKS